MQENVDAEQDGHAKLQSNGRGVSPPQYARPSCEAENDCPGWPENPIGRVPCWLAQAAIPRPNGRRHAADAKHDNRNDCRDDDGDSHLRFFPSQRVPARKLSNRHANEPSRTPAAAQLKQQAHTAALASPGWAVNRPAHAMFLAGEERSLMPRGRQAGSDRRIFSSQKGLDFRREGSVTVADHE